MTRIADGDLKEGERVPSVARLAEEFGVSVSTVDRAILILKELRLIRGEAGRARWVASGARDRAVAHLSEDAGGGGSEEADTGCDLAGGASEVHPNFTGDTQLPDAAAP